MTRSSWYTQDALAGKTQSEEALVSAQQIAPPVVPALTVLYHRDWRQIGRLALLTELTAGHEVALSRTSPLFIDVADAQDCGAPLGDPRLSRQPLRIAPQPEGGIRLNVTGSRTRVRYRGADVSGTQDISKAELLAGGVLELGVTTALVLHLGQIGQVTDEERYGLFGRSHRMQALREQIRRIAALEAPVLIQGETGTGKELVARALHAASRRAAGPFVAINLGAIPSSLAAAELFGAERGAFTGASGQQRGHFHQARGGTLFLDEIGEASPEVQVLLLRALETSEFRALGASAPQQLKARIITATDANLEALIRKNAFRAPLLHRLAAYELQLPPLRERREDIGQLLLHFLRLECAAQQRPFPLDNGPVETGSFLPLWLVVRLAVYNWPGNVRQLRNAVRQMLLASEGSGALALPKAFIEQEAAPEPVKQGAARRKPAEISEAELHDALEKNRWDLKATAEMLGIARPSLYMLLERSPNIRTARNLSAEELEQAHRECRGDLDAMAEKLRVSRSALRRRIRESPLR